MLFEVDEKVVEFTLVLPLVFSEPAPHPDSSPAPSTSLCYGLCSSEVDQGLLPQMLGLELQGHGHCLDVHLGSSL